MSINTKILIALLSLCLVAFGVKGFKHWIAVRPNPIRYNAVLPNVVINTAPAIFFSDLTAGPNTGGQNNNGVFVTIWGNNFGSTRGTSYITVGGGQAGSYLTWTNNMICFQLGGNAATGEIVLVTSNGNATGPFFTVKSGNIYFVDPKATTSGSGTYTSPFNHLLDFEQIANPGDTVYVRSGTIYDEEDGHPGWHSMIVPERGGLQGSPVSWIAYPNETVKLQVDGGSQAWPSEGTDNVNYIFKGYTDWHTISKFTMILSGTGGTSAVESTGFNGWKVVGNNITASAYSYAIVGLAGNYSQVLGNEIHDSGNSTYTNMNHSIYWDGGGSNVEIGWNYLHDNKNTGWEISCFHQGTRNGSIHDNLITNTSGYPLKGILLGGVDNGEDETTVEAQHIDVYNNMLYNLGYNEYGGAIQAVSGTAHIYNNTIYQSPESKGTVQFPAGGTGPGGGRPVWYFANNIIYNSISNSPYLSDGNGSAPTWTNFALLTNNNYYGAGKGPSQDQNPVYANPLFVSNGSNFHLQPTSPDISVGYDTTSIVTTDLDGNTRPQGGEISIGAYQYGGGSLVLSTSAVNIFIASSLDRIFQDGKTLLKPNFANTATISLAKNEYQSFQVVVQTKGNGSNNVELKISDLLNAKTRSKIDKENMAVRVVGYVHTSKPYYPVKYIGNWPDPLMPDGPINIKANMTQPFWVTIYVPSETLAGDYKGNITVIADNKPLKRIPLSIHVYNFELPKGSHLKTAFGFQGQYIKSKYLQGELEKNEAYRSRINDLDDKYIMTMLQYRMNPILNLDPASQIELSNVDRYLVHGLNNFSIGKRGGDFKNNWPTEDKSIEDLFLSYRTYGEDLKINNILQYSYVYVWDEGDMGNPQVAKIASMTHRAYPGLKNMVTYHGIWDPAEFPGWGKDIDIWCFSIDEFNEAKLRHLQKMGIETWMYVSGPSSNNMPNLAIDFDSLDYRIIPWLCWKYDIKGFLYWSVNHWPPDDPFKNTRNTKWEQNGNGLLFYPGKDGPLESLRMEIFREGMQDYEYIQLLFEDLKIFKRKHLDEKYGALFNDSVKLLTIDDSIAVSMSKFTKDGEVLKARRNAIALKIEEFNLLRQYLQE